MVISETQIRVRYSETDQMGYVYYGNYAQYFEVGRVELLRQLGMSYKGLEESGIMMPVISMSSKYLKPAKYDNLLTVRTFIKEKPQFRCKFEYEVLNEMNELLHVGETTLVFIDIQTSKPVNNPKQIADKFDVYFK